MKKFLVTILMALSLSASAEVCFPKNDLRFPVGMKSAGGLSQAQFEQSIKRVSDIYAPIFVSEYKATLEVENHWDDATVNAYAFQEGSVWKVAMFGGLARSPETTQDGFEAVICHEVGHHLGGAVKYPASGNEWASNEGQSDYFATSKCLKKVFAADLTKTVALYNKLDLTADELIAKKACDSVYASESEAAICLRSALAGQSLARLLGSLGGEKKVAFGTPDKSVVSRTNHNHPKAQCRMDTYLAGGLCDKADSIFPDSKDVAVGFCTKKEGYSVGIRPACWYKAAEFEK
jgi:hypothetical protein